MMKFKKASLELSLNTIIGIVLAFMLILSTMVFFGKLINIFISKADQGTISTYNEVYDAIEALYDPQNTNTSCKITSVYIKPGFALVGFSQGTTGSKEYCGMEDVVNKPRNCLGNACLCLCRGGVNDVSGDDCSSTCRRFNLNTKQLKTHDDKGQSRDLVVYGESCWFGINRNVIPGYVLKKEQEGTLTVYQILDESQFQTYHADTKYTCKQIMNSVKQTASSTTPSKSTTDSTSKPALKINK